MIRRDDWNQVNLQYLLLLREIAADPVGEMITGIPWDTLRWIRGLNLEQVRRLAHRTPLSLFGLRATRQELERVLRMEEDAATAYVAALDARRDRHVS
ncbi:hypothetical protein [Methylococcus capsulatus]|jgi:hypothetical protein|uniref:hypothetical protein n=1 Tax=Methylococcus capsulatus TaxID=414 RepID=UPI001C52D527|nr:hypothetical protein [Methylococcus capsulatus]QXP89481.1 hypothetical protein KW114_10195 [Methylococcus capsulatus]